MNQESTEVRVALCQRSPGFPYSSTRFYLNAHPESSCTVLQQTDDLFFQMSSTQATFVVPENEFKQFTYGDTYDVWMLYRNISDVNDQYHSLNDVVNYYYDKPYDHGFRGRMLCGNLRVGMFLCSQPKLNWIHVDYSFSICYHFS